MMYVTILISILSTTEPFDGVRLLLSMLFISDFAPRGTFGYVPGGTTIDLEMTFYVLFPFLVPYMHKWWLPVTFVIIRTILYYMVHTQNWIPYEIQYHFILKQGMYFCMGGFIYHLWNKRYLQFVLSNYYLLPMIFLFGLWLMGKQDPLNAILMWLYFGMLLLVTAYSKFPLLDNKIMRYIGTLSFSIYLLHFSFILAMAKYIKIYGGFLYGISGIIIVLIPTVLVSMITYRYIEQPGIRFGKNLIKKLHKDKI